MNLPSTVPVTVSPEAEAHVEAMGTQAEFERMLEHTVNTVADLQRIRVVLDPPYDPGDWDAVIIEAYKNPGTFRIGDKARAEWRDWFIKTFPPDVARHFVLFLMEGN